MDKIPVPILVIFCVLAVLLIAAIITGRLILSAGKGMSGNFQYMILLGAKVNGTEAQCMYDRLVALGIEPERIWQENKAVNTKQNIRYSMALLKEKTDTQPATVGILSSDTHLLRARLLARRQGITAITVPAPSTHRNSYLKHFLREIPVIWYYWLIGL